MPWICNPNGSGNGNNAPGVSLYAGAYCNPTESPPHFYVYNGSAPVFPPSAPIGSTLTYAIVTNVFPGGGSLEGADWVSFDKYLCRMVADEGTVLGEYCNGPDLYRTEADGSGGTRNVLVERNSPLCYIPDGSGSGGGGGGSASGGGGGSPSGSSMSGSGSSQSKSSSSKSAGSKSSSSGNSGGSGSSAGSKSGGSSSSSGSSSKSSSSSSSPSGGSKLAIVRALDTWVGWSCAESELSWFEVVREIRITKRDWVRQRAEVVLPIEAVLVMSCEPGSLLVTDVIALPCPAMLTAEVCSLQSGQCLKVVAVVPRGFRRPHAVRARVRGVRLGHAAAWPRFTAAEAKSNDLFYRTATQLIDTSA